MTQQLINRGSAPSDPAAETIYEAFGKVNANFDDLYAYRLIAVANEAALPATGTAGYLYKTNDLGRLYQWTGAAYVLLNQFGWSRETFLVTVAGTSRQFTFVVPAGVTLLLVKLRGGGGSGGSGNDTSVLTTLTAGSGGSGADGYEYVPIPVTPGETLYCQVGHGGLAPTALGQAGAAGGESYLCRVDHKGQPGSVTVLSALGGLAGDGGDGTASGVGAANRLGNAGGAAVTANGNGNHATSVSGSPAYGDGKRFGAATGSGAYTTAVTDGSARNSGHAGTTDISGVRAGQGLGAIGSDTAPDPRVAGASAGGGYPAQDAFFGGAGGGVGSVNGGDGLSYGCGGGGGAAVKPGTSGLGGKGGDGLVEFVY